MYVCVYCLLISLACSPKAELRKVQLEGIGGMHVKGASGCQTAMNDPGAQQLRQTTTPGTPCTYACILFLGLESMHDTISCIAFIIVVLK